MINLKKPKFLFAVSFSLFLTGCVKRDPQKCDLQKETITVISTQIRILEGHNRLVLKNFIEKKELNFSQLEKLFYYELFNALSSDIIVKSGGYDSELGILANPLDTIVPREVLNPEKIWSLAENEYALLIERYPATSFDYAEFVKNSGLLTRIDQSSNLTVIAALFELLVMENILLVDALKLEHNSIQQISP